MTGPLAGTIFVCALGLFALSVRFVMGTPTDPFVWLIVVLAFGASCFIAYENRPPNDPRPR